MLQVGANKVWFYAGGIAAARPSSTTVGPGVRHHA
jgi:hypothetical protein